VGGPRHGETLERLTRRFAVRFTIRHTTRYSYGRRVVLGPMTVRLRPRSDATQRLDRFQLHIRPAPAGQSESVDVDGNAVTHAWFEEPQDFVSIVVSADVETLRRNPFDFVAPDGTMLRLPLRYDDALEPVLAPYLRGSESDQQFLALAHDLMTESSGHAPDFLMRLTRLLWQEIRQDVRETGDPHPPAHTWATRHGACRDLAVLFREISRHANIATRFVSGYAEGYLVNPRQDLHAWVEAYLPGGGWRGFDPSMGMAVADRHVAVAASAVPALAAPVSGSVFDGTVDATLWYDIAMTTDAT